LKDIEKSSSNNEGARFEEENGDLNNKEGTESDQEKLS
jgi:hypothetical protein